MPLSTRRSFTANVARLVRQHRLDGDPFIIAEFVAHDSKLRSERLNHTHSRIINPQRPVAWPLTFSIDFRFRRHRGHGWTCRWLTPVANAPSQTCAV
jgi:hypothetical protein